MNIIKSFQALALLLSGLGAPLVGHGQTYFYSGPISGSFDMLLWNQNRSAIFHSGIYIGGTVCSFETLNETVYLDQASGTIRQVGFIFVTPSSGTWVVDDDQTVNGTIIPATLTLNLNVTAGGLSFDTGPQHYDSFDGISSISETSGSPAIPPIAFDGSYSWSTGGQNYSDSFNYQLDFGLALYNSFSIADPRSITLSMPQASGTTLVAFPALTNAANGLSLLLGTGGNDHASHASWTGGITATIVPEPGSFSLFGLGLSTLVFSRPCRRWSFSHNLPIRFVPAALS